MTHKFITSLSLCRPATPKVVAASICYPIVTEATTCWRRAMQRPPEQAKWFHPLTAPAAERGIESLILSPLLVVREKSMADLEKALRHTVNGILYCWKLSPALLLPHPSTRRRRSINNFHGSGRMVRLLACVCAHRGGGSRQFWRRFERT